MGAHHRRGSLRIARGEADLVLSAEQWDTVRRSGLLTPEEASLLDEGLARHYRKQAVGYFHVWTKTVPDASGTVATSLPSEPKP